jgi:hypothetical protein
VRAGGHPWPTSHLFLYLSLPLSVLHGQVTDVCRSVQTTEEYDLFLPALAAVPTPYWPRQGAPAPPSPPDQALPWS